MRTPQSLVDAIQEEPERFIKYLDLNKISSASNPYQEFIKQFQKKFNSKNGLNLWMYIVGKYKILNELYKNEEIQRKLVEKFRGSLKRKEVKTFFIKDEERIKKQSKIRQIKIKKPIQVKSYLRNGRKINSYSSSKKHIYTDRQIKFINSRPNMQLKRLFNEFNSAFKTSVSEYGIRDKRLRLLGRKE